MRQRVFLNPTLHVESSRTENGRAVWRVALHTRRNGPQVLTVSAALAGALVRLRYEGQPASFFDGNALAALIKQELLVREVLPAPRLELPLIVPEAAPRQEELQLDPRFELHSEPERGAILIERGSGDWIATEYAVGAEIAAEFLAWSEGRADPQTTRERASLQAIGCLASSTAIRKARERCNRDLTEWRQVFNAERYVTIDPLLSRQELAALRRYALAVRDRGFLDGDFGVCGKRRSHVFDDSQFRRLHHRTAGLASAVTGCAFVPTYSFLAFYHAGGALPRHRDKRHCHLSISLCIDADRVASEWPLFLETPAGDKTAVTLRPGQGLLFNGRYYAHRRDPLPESGGAIVLVLHYQADLEFQ